MSVSDIFQLKATKAHYELGKYSYTFEYDCYADEFDNPDDVRAAVFDGPADGAYFFNGTVLMSIDVELFQGSDLLSIWKSTLNYETVPPWQQEIATGVNPLSRDPIITFHTKENQVIIEEDNDENAITNSAGEKFLEGAEARQGQASISAVKNFEEWTVDDSAQFIFCTNEGDLFDMGEKTLLCTNISAQQQSEIIGGSNFTYWQVTFEFESDTEKQWQLWIEDRGLNYLTTDSNGNPVLQPCVVNSTPVQTPVYLDGFGNQVPDGVEIPESSTLKFDIYPSVDFSELGLDS